MAEKITASNLALSTRLPSEAVSVPSDGMDKMIAHKFKKERHAQGGVQFQSVMQQALPPLTLLAWREAGQVKSHDNLTAIHQMEGGIKRKVYWAGSALNTAVTTESVNIQHGTLNGEVMLNDLPLPATITANSAVPEQHFAPSVSSSMQDQHFAPSVSSPVQAQHFAPLVSSPVQELNIHSPLVVEHKQSLALHQTLTSPVVTANLHLSGSMQDSGARDQKSVLHKDTPETVSTQPYSVLAQQELPPRQEASTVSVPHQPPHLLKMTSTVEAPATLGMEYRFRSWEGNHSVRLAVKGGQLADNPVLLHPSGVRVADALSQQVQYWPEKSPLVLAPISGDESGEGQQHRQQQQDEEEQS
ncbi:SpaN/EivJ family type III secretion system needle length determinant [Enterobacter sp. 22466]|uniref:SpaN/EivJ family type III secretion system needle length determinant n=1 Tax=Enterobacter sp. 22466 TaxID=3453924 RepID=UPI003F84D545